MVDATVLIIGCGPTGLIVAHELLRRGINCRPVDKRPAPQSSTRAFTVHARTMEMFDRLGIAYRVERFAPSVPETCSISKPISRPNRCQPWIFGA
jgi:2-polyprenyl-6-methoxyphenol hydroxylase-like FAD-dependent oxidoreductase